MHRFILLNFFTYNILVFKSIMLRCTQSCKLQEKENNGPTLQLTQRGYPAHGSSTRLGSNHFWFKLYQHRAAASGAEQQCHLMLVYGDAWVTLENWSQTHFEASQCTQCIPMDLIWLCYCWHWCCCSVYVYPYFENKLEHICFMINCCKCLEMGRID